ncbi:hypothetical protein KEU06_01270 [Pseudaminobacter sp. 19-2017]|uniref:Uncharacterized protein n=1 Tax=Pseudaminobacter soli (ex Zhang et al. 2022) TaxID=2831468 RepID=A0A942I7N1_9HYPH|nr:class I SAM-dependent methyltransferase [Pseudaminobacter soli]MBS3647256.1 hypothetical protein [Pseudaminobacter soli]
MNLRLTRLDKLYYRLQAQHVCLNWAATEIAPMSGVVFELGLGHGRTYDHLRTRLPDREIHVFDREVDCIADCTPPDDRLWLGDVDKTLAAAQERFGGRVVLLHADLGTYEAERNEVIKEILRRRVPPLLAPGAIVLSDLPLVLEGASPLPLPDGAREGRYFLYRRSSSS